MSKEPQPSRPPNRTGKRWDKAPSSPEEGVGGGAASSVWLRERAREMRNDPTEPEKQLWQSLRGSQLHGLKFRRQAVKGDRILDFYCPALRLGIEVDGMTHDRVADVAGDTDFERTTGIRTLRFTNEEVMQELDAVLAAVFRAAAHEPPPDPLL